MKVSDKPMMSNEEISIIDELLKDRKFCLEWGSGASTLYFPSKHKVNWLSVEHNGHYVEHFKDKLPDNVTLIWADGEWYIDSVKLSRKYDFILVDGEFREDCVSIGLTMLNEDGVLLLHDSGRREYQAFIEEFKGEKLTEGEVKIKAGGFAHRGLTLFRRPNVEFTN